ncbi:MAG TPA: hypothetical protein VE046_13595 [Steroidobacteraceae bacterium]|nr:hypothetical protein [Steroidobacteraceae bacterium]
MRSRRALVAAAALWALPPLAWSADPPPADDEFLEFLGSTDSDDPQFNDFMASGDVDAVLEDSKEGSKEGNKTQPASDAKPANKVTSDAT